jgi:hypothetical protein
MSAGAALFYSVITLVAFCWMMGTKTFWYVLFGSIALFFTAKAIFWIWLFFVTVTNIQ